MPLQQVSLGAGQVLSSQLCLVETEGLWGWRSQCACGHMGRLICCSLLLHASALNIGPSPAIQAPGAHCIGEHREEERGSRGIAVASDGGWTLCGMVMLHGEQHNSPTVPASYAWFCNGAKAVAVR